jgi:uncharacterized protein (TIGR02284 family)
MNTKKRVMENNNELIEVLNDLIEINNDRIQGYQKAIEEIQDSDSYLAETFRQMIRESEEYKNQLRQMVLQHSGEPETNSTTQSGKLYRFWMELKSVFTGHSRKSVLESCEFGEDATQKAYQEALESDATMDTDVRTLIKNQKTALKNSHDSIKAYRDSTSTKFQKSN